MSEFKFRNLNSGTLFYCSILAHIDKFVQFRQFMQLLSSLFCIPIPSTASAVPVIEMFTLVLMVLLPLSTFSPLKLLLPFTLKISFH